MKSFDEIKPICTFFKEPPQLSTMQCTLSAKIGKAILWDLTICIDAINMPTKSHYFSGNYHRRPTLVLCLKSGPKKKLTYIIRKA